MTKEYSSFSSSSMLKKYSPVIILLSWLSFTVLVFAFGPWPWPVASPIKLYGFLVLAHLAIFLGYYSTSGKVNISKPVGPIAKIQRISIIFALAFSLLTIYSSTGDDINLVTSLENPGRAYLESQKIRESSNSPVGIVSFFLGPFIVLFLPLSVVFWDKLTRFIRFLAIVALLMQLASWILKGTNKGLFDLIIQLPFLLYIRHISAPFRVKVTPRFILISLMVAFIFFSLFFLNKSVTGRSFKNEASYFNPFVGISANNDDFILSNAPRSVGDTWLIFSSYISQGYYGLSLSLDKPFIWSYGIGHSIFLQLVYERITGDSSVASNTYPGRNETENGWLRYNAWHSIYPWLASDITFPGTLILLFFVGRIFCQSWYDSIYNNNPFGIVVFSQLLIGLFYFSANNQLLQVAYSWSGFIITYLFWRMSRTKGNYKLLNSG